MPGLGRWRSRVPSFEVTGRLFFVEVGTSISSSPVPCMRPPPRGKLTRWEKKKKGGGRGEGKKIKKGKKS